MDRLLLWEISSACRNIDWQNMLCTSEQSHMMLYNSVMLNGFTQHVLYPTRLCNNLDLVLLLYDPLIVSNIEIDVAFLPYCRRAARVRRNEIITVYILCHEVTCIYLYFARQLAYNGQKLLLIVVILKTEYF